MRYQAVVAALLLSGLAQAEPVSLVSGDDYAPYADSKLPEGGMTTELIKKAFAEVKLETKVDWQPWARGLDETKNGKFAGTYPYLKNADREKDFLYSSVVVKLVERAFIKAGNKKLDFNNLSSLKGSTICLPLGWAPSSKIAEMVKSGDIKKSSPKDVSTCVKMVASDRADYFISDEIQGAAALKTGGVPAGTVVASDVVLADNSLYLIASKSLPGSKDLLASFDKGLETIRKNGVYAKVVKAHAK